MRKKFKIITLGCRTNQYESQAFSDQLKGLGLAAAKDEDIPDYCIVNGCSVTKNADKKSLSSIKFLKKRYPRAEFFLTGCLNKKEFESIENIKIIPNAQKKDLVAQIFPQRAVPKFYIKNFENHTRAFIKIQDGCDSFCSYCIVPYTRGGPKSRDFEDILYEIDKLIDNGYKEIVLTGISLGKYKSLLELLKKIEKKEEIQRIKLSSIDPEFITNELIHFFVNCKKFVKSLHLVLQSGSDSVLKRMNRKYSAETFLEKIDKIRLLDPDFTFSTDIIIGFPGETDADFQKTLDVVKKVKFVKVHIFTYSKRPDTAASFFEDQIKKEVIDQRKKMLLKTVLEESNKELNKYVDKEMRVLFENVKDNFFVGHTQNNLLVHVPKDEKICSNAVMDVRILKNLNNCLVGELCK